MCLHGLTQNAKEFFNVMIWERVPKIRFVGFVKLKFGVFDAVASFNIGSKAPLQIMEVLNLIPGNYTTKGCITINNSRLRQAQYKNTEKVKLRRKIIRGKKKSSDDNKYSKRRDYL